LTIDVLVVDDTAVARRLLVRAVEADPEIRAIGTAASGREALDLLGHLEPDIVTLDLEMPDLGGLATLRLLRRRHPRLPVIVVSALSESGSRKALEALAAGANDFVTRPSRVASIEAGVEGLRNQLVPKIKALHGKSVRQRARLAAPGSTTTVPAADRTPVAVPAPTAPLAPHDQARERPAPSSVPAPRWPASSRPPEPPSTPAPRIDVIAIGGSTGGPAALEALLIPLRADLPVPILIVQHMPPNFTRLLAERLNTLSALRVREAADGDQVRAGEVLIAPGNFHLSPTRRSSGAVVVRLNQEPPENHCRPAADVLFRGVAEVYGAHALGVVLTGMGSDGLAGARALRGVGSQTVVQDEESSVVWGMAGSVAAAGLAQQVLPLPALSAFLAESARRERPGAAHRPAGSA
jgi:two-component system chemotaxis response regulator CheB